MAKKKTIIGEPLPNIPWEDKPKGCIDVVVEIQRQSYSRLEPDTQGGEDFQQRSPAV